MLIVLDFEEFLSLSNFMETWRVFKFVKANGRCPYDEWLDSKEITENDIAAVEAKIAVIQMVSGRLPPETLKKLKGHELKELKIRGDKKQLRPLCVVAQDKKIIILCGAIEKGSRLPKGDLERGKNLATEWERDEGSIEEV